MTIPSRYQGPQEYEPDLQYERTSVDVVLGAFRAGTHALTFVNEGVALATLRRRGQYVNPNEAFGAAVVDGLIKDSLGGGTHANHPDDPRAALVRELVEYRAVSSYISYSLAASQPQPTYVPELPRE
jgi:hypothetical protein